MKEKVIRKPDSDLEYCAKHDCFIDPKDIINVVAQVPGEADELNWHWIVQMKNKKFKYITGGCDYSGWGCQDWGNASEDTTTARKACALSPRQEEYHKEYNIQKQLLDQLKGEQPYGTRVVYKP